MALAAYLTSLQRLLGTGTAQNLYSNTDLTAYINEARTQIALRTQCIRRLTPISGPITSFTVLSGGSGYSTPTVIVAAPDFPSGIPPTPLGAQATATVNSGTALTTITVQSAGDGYFSPVVTLSGSGSGARVQAVVSGINVTVVGQETYRFRDINGIVALSGSGVQSVYSVHGISLLYASARFTLQKESLGKYQALSRSFAFQFQYVPNIWCQNEQGAFGTVMMYPVPGANYQMEWDTSCLPMPLVTDADVEAIPPPWTDAVKYFAAYLAFSGKQRFADADRMNAEFEKFLKQYRANVSPGGVNNWYGRTPGYGR